MTHARSSDDELDGGERAPTGTGAAGPTRSGERDGDPADGASADARRAAPGEDGAATADVPGTASAPIEAGASDAAGPAGAAAGDAEDHDGAAVPPASEVARLEEELAALGDRHLRLVAEFNNYRRRVEQERIEAWNRAQADLVARLLDVLDDLERVAALDLSDARAESVAEGVELVERKFRSVLGEAGVEVIDPVGEAFDPETMEALTGVPADVVEADDTVAQVFQKGYRLKRILVRPARVGVYKHGEP